jgi:cellobiose phosphorylase
MEFTWITGSVAWYNTVILNEMLGANPNYNGLEIKPNIPSEWNNCSVKRHFRGADYDITIIRNKDGKASIVVDGNEIMGNIVPAFGDGKLHSVVVTIV